MFYTLSLKPLFCCGLFFVALWPAEALASAVLAPVVSLSACRFAWNNREGDTMRLISITESKYSGPSGWKQFLSDFSSSDDSREDLIRSVIATFSKSRLDGFDWPESEFYGAVLELRDLRDKLFDSKGQIRPEYKKVKGFLQFVEDHSDGKYLNEVFNNVFKALSKNEFDLLEWPEPRPSGYAGNTYRSVAQAHPFQRDKAPESLAVTFKTTKELSDFREKLVHPDGSLREQWTGITGQLNFMETENVDGTMAGIFSRLSEVLNERELQSIQWIDFPGSAKYCRFLRNTFLTPEGLIKAEYAGLKGSVRYEKDHKGSTLFTLQKVRKVLSKKERESLGWTNPFGPQDPLMISDNVVPLQTELPLSEN